MSEIELTQEQKESQKALEIVRAIQIDDAMETGFTPEQLAALRKVFEDAAQIFSDLMEETRKALSILAESFRDIRKAYIKAHSDNERCAHKQSLDYWFLYSQRKFLLIE